MMASASAFFPETPELQRNTNNGRLQGLGNLWHHETKSAWGKHRWLTSLIVWLLLLDGLSAASAATPFTVQEAVNNPGLTRQTFDLFFWLLFALIFTIAGTIISAQNLIIGERQSGTAAWIMSKPVTAAAFILAKCAALPKLLLTQVLLPFVVFLPIISAVNGTLPTAKELLFSIAFITALDVFFFTLTLMLGTFFRTRTPVLGVGFFGLFIVAQSMGNPLLSLLAKLHAGQEVAVATMLVAIFAFGAVLALLTATWRFKQEEF